MFRLLVFMFVVTMIVLMRSKVWSPSVTPATSQLFPNMYSKKLFSLISISSFSILFGKIRLSSLGIINFKWPLVIFLDFKIMSAFVLISYAMAFILWYFWSDTIFNVLKIVVLYSSEERRCEDWCPQSIWKRKKIHRWWGW